MMASLALAEGCLSLWFKEVNRQIREATLHSAAVERLGPFETLECERTYVLQEDAAWPIGPS
jgi:hypothetical protein